MLSALEHLHVRQVHEVDVEPSASDRSLQGRLEHPQTGLRYQLNPTSALIWERLRSETRFSVLASHLAAEFDLDEEQAADGLLEFIHQFGDLGFVAIDDGSEAARLRALYLDLLKSALVNSLYPEHELRIEHLEKNGPQPDSARFMRDIRYADPDRFQGLLAHKAGGLNWQGGVAKYSHTMVGLRRLQNLEWCASIAFRDGVEGDFLEAGVCQGGASIFLRALQIAYAEGHRRMWLADSFEGLPEPACAEDQGYDFTESVQPWLAVGEEAVRDNFRTYGLLSEQVRFISGWFDRSLADAPVDALALLRIDADLYASTRDVLTTLYDKVTPGGFIVVDDYHAFPPCRQAVDEFREARGIREPLIRVDWTAVFWRRP